MDMALQPGRPDEMTDDLSTCRATFAEGLNNVHAQDELVRFGVIVPEPEADKTGVAVYLDCTDLLAYFAANRFPTGIQRVQIELFKASVLWTGEVSIEACAWSDGAGFWATLDPEGFGALCTMAGESGGKEVNDRWRAAVDGVKQRLSEQQALIFPIGSVLVNLGASWWMADYMAGIRNAKARFGVRYVPLIYDMIPLITPEHCAAGLQSAFAAWASSVFMHADLLGAISDRTRQDVDRYARAVKPLIHEPVVMPLDARFGAGDAGLTAYGREAILDGFGLEPGGFVLVVGTLEVRKNHRLLFDGWRRLIGSEDADRVPMLVCVGKQGFRYDILHDYLDSHAVLAEKVLLLSGVSDVELETLYAECLFTVYSSFYEGWGLPVTESLCHGKVCLCADHSSLPEAGGPFATYYSIDSVRDFVEKARRLISDAATRSAQEEIIANDFQPRSWGEVLEGFIGQVVTTWQPGDRAPPLVAELKLGTIYQTRRRLDLLRLDRDTAVAEMLRVGASWHPLEDWGMWSRERQARLSFLLAESPDPGQDLLMYLSLLCARVQTATVTIRLGDLLLTETVIGRGERRMVQARIPAAALQSAGCGPYILEIATDQLVSMRLLNDRDHRDVGVGLSSVMLCRWDDIAARLDVAERQTMLVPD